MNRNRRVYNNDDKRTLEEMLLDIAENAEEVPDEFKDSYSNFRDIYNDRMKNHNIDIVPPKMREFPYGIDMAPACFGIRIEHDLPPIPPIQNFNDYMIPKEKLSLFQKFKSLFKKKKKYPFDVKNDPPRLSFATTQTPSFAMRAMGNVEENEKGEKVVKPLHIMTYDMVLYPSHLYKKRPWYKKLWGYIRYNIKWFFVQLYRRMTWKEEDIDRDI